MSGDSPAERRDRERVRAAWREFRKAMRRWRRHRAAADNGPCILRLPKRGGAGDGD